MSVFQSDEQEAAHYGAMLLDEREPGWYKRIDKTTLNVASEEFCILAQLYKDHPSASIYNPYTVGSDVLFEGDETALELHGFYREDASLASYKKLTECWQQEIDKRLLA